MEINPVYFNSESGSIKVKITVGMWHSIVLLCDTRTSTVRSVSECHTVKVHSVAAIFGHSLFLIK